MENASNALIIAAGVLIGVLILSLAVYLFMDFGKTSKDIHKKVTVQQTVQANSKFTSFEGQEGLTIYDVVTLATYANENNKYYSDNLADYEIKVILNNKRGTINKEIQKDIDEDKIEYINKDKEEIKDSKPSLPTYKCEIISYHDNGRVHEIKFTEKE